MSVFVDIVIGPNHTTAVATRRIRIDRVSGLDRSVLDITPDEVFTYRAHMSMGDRRQLTATFEHFYAEDVFALIGEASAALKRDAEKRHIAWD